MISFLIVFCLALEVLAFDPLSRTNVALYWGQKPGKSSLAEYCQDDSVDILVISSLSKLSYELGNLDLPLLCKYDKSEAPCNRENYPEEFEALAKDIKFCQSKNKIVLLSVELVDSNGSPFTGDYPYKLVELLDQLYMNVGGIPTELRPFGDVVLDGFDMHMNPTYQAKNVEQFSPDFYMDMKSKLHSSKPVYISVSPDCLDVRAWYYNMLAIANIDFIFPRFYDLNKCQTRVSEEDAHLLGYHLSTSKFANINIKFYAGLYADPGTRNDHTSPESLYDIFASQLLPFETKAFEGDLIGGAAIWNAGMSDENIDMAGRTYAQQIKYELNALAAMYGATSRDYTCKEDFPFTAGSFYHNALPKLPAFNTNCSETRS
ncbi:glycoside hydrolase family 18 protein [Tortispora caseinolytica NRRL Y-17796]|uniref:Glycoside hydrolase family 18 protein n=1 Tax=Tortispora caseinolytica NRRL Y-17796 TaxID=767744 RepID=A0A1E4TIW5_9ASCO|nr:glycoside hydrolase family 18 protein [Tortispora caseinolytica NRRL Y-17796]